MKDDSIFAAILGVIGIVLIVGGALFLFQSWIVMIVWGMLGLSFHFFTIPFSQAMLVTLAMWLLQLPTILVTLFGSKK